MSVIFPQPRPCPWWPMLLVTLAVQIALNIWQNGQTSDNQKQQKREESKQQKTQPHARKTVKCKRAKAGKSTKGQAEDIQVTPPVLATAEGL